MENNYVDKIYELAVSAFNNDEIPVGAIVVKDGKIIAEGVNDREKSIMLLDMQKLTQLLRLVKF